jgi:nucleotide-binding universal stress UspA family protein
VSGAAGVLEGAGFEARGVTIQGDPDEALLRYQESREMDLLIMGAYGHSRIRRFLVGSTTTALLSRCRASMMVLR